MTRGSERDWSTASKTLEEKNMNERIVVALSMHSPRLMET